MSDVVAIFSLHGWPNVLAWIGLAAVAILGSLVALFALVAILIGAASGSKTSKVLFGILLIFGFWMKGGKWLFRLAVLIVFLLGVRSWINGDIKSASWQIWLPVLYGILALWSHKRFKAYHAQRIADIAAARAEADRRTALENARREAAIADAKAKGLPPPSKYDEAQSGENLQKEVFDT